MSLNPGTELPTNPELSSDSPTEMLRARKIALAILGDIMQRSRTIGQAIELQQGFTALPGVDRAFVRMLTATATRRLGQIDDFIRRATDNDKIPNPPELYNLLRLGVTQIVFMNVPDYAVVDTSVQIAVERNMSRQKGLVNAVLRRVARKHHEWVKHQDEVRCNIPEWLLKQWIEDYDLRTAAKIGQASLSEASLDITVKDAGKDNEMLDYWAGTLHAQVLPTGSLRRASGGGPVFDLPGFDDGAWWVQDIAAAIPARLFGDISGKKVIDLCAAPGGKTAQLASMGADVLALDHSVNRLKKLQENISRLHLEDSVKIEIADASIWLPKEPAEFVLLDAPCTATGTIRRNPDILHLKTAKDMDMLVAVQTRLLDNAVKMLGPGGILVYCTCSLQKAEGELQIERLLTDNKSLRRLPISAEEVGGLNVLLTEAGDIRSLPFHLAAHGGIDGFYIARLQLIET